jgi:hypothetical protein
MSLLIWFVWLVNQYFILIFAFNFLVSIISQAYEESLDQSVIKRYTFRCERVIEASLLTKLCDVSRTLQTFSLTTSNATEVHEWKGFVQTIRDHVRSENLSLRRALTSGIEDLDSKIDTKTHNLERQVKDLSKKLTGVNESINEKLDFMTEKFNEIRDIIKANIEDDESNAGGSHADPNMSQRMA